jgi:alpha-D-ribose 1-methylphosphonate 5-phosphate C-P lyase
MGAGLQGPLDAGSPFQVKSLVDGGDDVVHALDVHKADLGASAASYFDEAALDNGGGAQFCATSAGEREERQQLGQVSAQALN